MVLLYNKSHLIDTVGERLTDTAHHQWFDAGEVQGFTIPNGLTEMCFFINNINSNESKCEKTWSFLNYCGQNCTQHPEGKTVHYIDNTTRLVNFRMLPPSATLDKAYVIRVHNDTLVYVVEGHCNINESLYEEWTPIRLLQRYGLPNCSESCANCTDLPKCNESRADHNESCANYTDCGNESCANCTDTCKGTCTIAL